MISDAFQEFRKVEVAKEQLMMSVKGPRITGRQSLMMRMLTLSGPGDLLEGIDRGYTTFDLRTGNTCEIE